jgi:hypothetical protein
VCGPAFCNFSMWPSHTPCPAFLKTAPVPLPSPAAPLTAARKRRTPGAVQCPSGTHARNGKGEPLSAASPGLRSRYPQDGGTGPVPLQNVSRSVPVGQDAGEYGGGLKVGDELWRRKMRKSCKGLKKLERYFHLSLQDENPSPLLPPNVHFAACPPAAQEADMS